MRVSWAASSELTQPQRDSSRATALPRVYALLAELGRRARLDDDNAEERSLLSLILKETDDGEFNRVEAVSPAEGDARHNRPGVEHGGLPETTY